MCKLGPLHLKRYIVTVKLQYSVTLPSRTCKNSGKEGKCRYYTYSHIILTSCCITVLIVIIVMVINRHDKNKLPYIIFYILFSPSNLWLHTTEELPGAPPTIAAALSAAAPAPPPSAPSASPSAI